MNISGKFSKRPGSFTFAAYLLYFLFYAVSPLTIVVSHTHAENQASAVQPDILLSELIARKMAGNGDSRGHGSESFLIRKKRALLPEDNLAKIFPLETTARVSNGTFPIFPPKAVRAGAVPFGAGVREGFSPLYAGHSPPLV